MFDYFAEISERHARILSTLRQSPALSSSEVQARLGDTVALVTVKRDLSELLRRGFLSTTGSARSLRYLPTTAGLVFAPVDAVSYAGLDLDTRGGFTEYRRDLFSTMPHAFFSESEIARLEEATRTFKDRANNVSDTLARRELERFVIELSWKSSRIEGNTYTLLDTERLLRDGVPSPNHTSDEATMIVNHKKAFEFVLTNRSSFQGRPSRAAIEQVHRLLTEGLGINNGFRHGRVGITGSVYRPLDNPHQIREAMDDLLAAVGRMSDRFSAALLLLAGLSYLQPFEDGNKRTARLSTNAVLVAADCCPLSYRSVDEAVYREATLTFYETSSIVALKNIFTEQYLFAADQYGLHL